MARRWTSDEVLELVRAYQPACVLTAAADLDVFTLLTDGPATATALASKLGADVRATTILLNALVAMELLAEEEGRYAVPPGVADVLSESGARNVLPMVRHQSNCLRRWAQLARVVKTGRPAQRGTSIRGEQADEAAFIGAMHTISAPTAARLIGEMGPPAFRCVLDVGGASGTWTIALLNAVPTASAILFDLPSVVPMARQRLAEAGLSGRVTFVAGDFYVDPLPAGADLVWLSAIAHQNSREQNRELFRKIHAALDPGGSLIIRDIVMDESHTRPAAGAMFAVNMLVGTEAGGTYTFEEYRSDLEAAGFADVRLLRRDPWMDSLIRACRRA